MTIRRSIRITAWPDPLVQERLEDIGFFFDTACQSWVKFCEETPGEVTGNDAKAQAFLATMTINQG